MEQETSRPTILQVQNVTRKFSDGSLALNKVSVSLNENDFIVIAGSNGSGKTVLMNLIANLDEPSSGKIIIKKGFEAGLVFQNADSQILGETPYEDVAFGAKNCGLKGTALTECVERSLLQTGLSAKKNLSSRTMSGGEKRRLAVAGILAMGRPLIIFDEPFANLDWPGVQQVTAILSQLKSQGKSIILLTHELEKVLALANRFIILDKGEIRFDGSPENGLKEPLQNYGIKNPLIKYDSLESLVWK